MILEKYSFLMVDRTVPSSPSRADSSGVRVTGGMVTEESMVSVQYFLISPE